MQTTFDYAEHKPYTEKGNNTIRGQGFLRQNGGDVVTCAGNTVVLLPATGFFREVISHFRAGRNPLQGTKLDTSYQSILKQSLCDAQGNFSFTGLPDGTWLVGTEVTWRVGYGTQGGSLMREVRVENGETTQVLLSQKDFVGR